VSEGHIAYLRGKIERRLGRDDLSTERKRKGEGEKGPAWSDFGQPVDSLPATQKFSNLHKKRKERTRQKKKRTQRARFKSTAIRKTACASSGLKRGKAGKGAGVKKELKSAQHGNNHPGPRKVDADLSERRGEEGNNGGEGGNWVTGGAVLLCQGA